ncbi:MAG: hypothetical protein GY820_09485 [Gammaproteobacteria bacterium]|nr:hypothetical protein [Gammaproteobacteria bacterium]
MANVDSVMHNRNLARIKQAERELEELEGKAPVEEQQEEVEQEIEASVEEPAVRKAEVQQEEEPAEQEEEQELSAEEKSFKKRYGDLRRHSQEQKKELEARLAKLEGQLKQAADKELVLPKTQQDIDAWAKKYPDVAGLVEAIADKKAQERAADIDARLKEVEAMRDAAKREKAEVALLKRHPDFVEIREDDAFHKWAEKQPAVYQNALYDNPDDVDSVARVIDMYKVDMGIKAKKPTTDKGAAASVRTRGARTVVDAEESSAVLSESQVNKMSLDEFEKRQDEIMDAMRSGKFIYDISQ